MELAYSIHLGSDKNKKNSVRVSAKTNKSGTTSMSNNSIQNAQQLSRVDKHNYRKYDNEQDDIVIVRGTSSLYNDVKELYLKEFEESRIKYNENQRETRKINNYFTHISNNAKNDLACEIIIELGNKQYWDTKDIDFKKRMTSVYSKQVEDLEMLVPNFKVASAIIHYDETSPHMHIVGVPIKYKNKNGMEKQVGKSDVFTKESLKTLQRKMRILCIEYFNKEYNLNDTLKPKLKGRNIDINVDDMDNYTLMKQQLEKNQQKLEQSNKKSLELKESTKDVKELVEDLKTTLTSKDKYILKQEDKDKIINFIDKVNKTNSEYQNIQELSITLTNVDEELKYNREQINILTENNNSLELRVKTLDDKVKAKDDEINELETENVFLKSILSSFKEKFDKLIKFLKGKMTNNKDKEKYYEFSVDLYTHGIINDNEIKNIKNKYDNVIENNSKKQNDDFEL